MFLKKLLVAVISVVFTFTVLLLLANFFLTRFWKVDDYYLALWRLDHADFSAKYIFWAKSHCTLNPNFCNNPEEKILPNRVVFYGDCENDPHPHRVLFVGDSFTVGPWVYDEQVYTSHFAEKLSEATNHCVISMRLATHATGTQQQYARLLDTVDELKPTLVIWQFYYNDVFNEQDYNIFSLEGDKLVRKQLWYHPIVWAGKINQLHPKMRETGLGRYLLYTAQLKDILHLRTDWYTEGKQKWVKILDEVDQLANTHNFEWYTTIAPLECELTQEACDDNTEKQEILRSILKDRGNYLSMYELKVTASGSATVAGATTDHASWFNHTDDPAPPGNRHLSKEGNQLTGDILFQNFMQATPSTQTP